MVVALASQPSCRFCQSPIPVRVALCTTCRSPQPVGAEAHATSPFEVFGLPLRFRQKPVALQRKFYSLSRELHPDRFAAGSTEVRIASLERMSLVNSAYQILTHPELLRAWMLNHFGVSVPQALPAEWAERWFDVQDSENSADFAAFAQDLQAEIARRKSAITELEVQADAEWAQNGESAAPLALQEIAAAESMMSYLLSLGRDVAREGARRGSHGN